MKRVKPGLWILLGLVVLGVVTYRWICQPWVIPPDPIMGVSLRPTARPGDIVLLWKATAPSFGDLVVCAPPDQPENLVMGRIVGGAGDVVEVDRTGRLSLNGKVYPSDGACDKFDETVPAPATGDPVEVRCSISEFAGRRHMVGQVRGRTTQPFKSTVPAGHYFLLSDNRLLHDDSRDFGPVPVEQCDRAVFFRLWAEGEFSDADRRLMFLP